MEKTMILQRLLEFGIEKGFFVVKPVGMVEKTCCEYSSVLVIDFDYTKEKVARGIGLQEPKSCDLLVIIPEKNRIDFIEMKSIRNMIDRIDKGKEPTDEEIAKNISRFDFGAKLHGSFFIVDLIMNMRDFKLMREERKEYLEVEKNYFILVDIDPKLNPVEALALSLRYAAEESIETRAIKAMAKNLEDTVLINSVNKPQLICCNNLEDLYGNAL